MRIPHSLLLIIFAASVSLTQNFETPRRGQWVAGPRLNQRDLSGDAVAPGTFSLGPINKPATVFIGCRGVDGGSPVLELRASVPTFPGSGAILKQGQITIGDQIHSGALDSFPAGPQVIFVAALAPVDIAAFAKENSDDLGGLSIGFTVATRKGLISTELPSRNAALDAVFTACRVSLPTATSSSKREAAQVVSGDPPARALQSVTGSTKDRAHFEIEGIKLGMTLQQALTEAKTFGVPKVKSQAGTTYLSFKTRDLSFDNMFFGKSGTLFRMEVVSTKKGTPYKGPFDAKLFKASSETYKKAVELFGPPDDDSVGGSGAGWKNPDGSSAGFFIMDDVLEILAKEQR